MRKLILLFNSKGESMNKLFLTTLMSVVFAQAFALLPEHERQIARARESIATKEREDSRLHEQIASEKENLARLESRAHVAFAESQKAPREGRVE